METDGYGDWAPYVPVAQRRARALKKMAQRSKRGLAVTPVKGSGPKIAATVWGRTWCRHLERYSDFENRLPRGRTYVRNGSVVHLETGQGTVEAFVAGSELYEVSVRVQALAAPRWSALRSECLGRIDSLVELLRGTLDEGVMARVCAPDTGLFPHPREIAFTCSCPDGAGMCKHVAAVLYGVGVRLDTDPEVLFRLRGVTASDLVRDAELPTLGAQAPRDEARVLHDAAVADIFGVEMETTPPPAPSRPGARPQGRRGAKTAKAAKTAKTAKAAKTARAAKARPVAPAAAPKERLEGQGTSSEKRTGKRIERRTEPATGTGPGKGKGGGKGTTPGARATTTSAVAPAQPPSRHPARGKTSGRRDPAPTAPTRSRRAGGAPHGPGA